MLDTTFLSFLVITVISAVVAITYHDILRYRFLEGADARIGKMIVGWLGAWLGSGIFGNWWLKVENVYIVPAILGAFAAIHLSTLVWKAQAKIAEKRLAAVGAMKEEVRSKIAMVA